MSEDYYRSCASVVVIRKSDDFEVLLVHKPRKKDDWQLPQGGVEEGEEVEQAVLRELKEEAGIDARIIKKSGEVYQYDFPESYRRFRPDNVCGQRIEYVFATVSDDQEVKVDDDEIDKYAWVIPQNLPKYLKRKEYLKLVQNLAQEGINLLGST